MWPPEVGRGKDWILPSSLEGVWPCRQLDFRVLVSRTERKYSSVVFSYYFVAFFFISAQRNEDIGSIEAGHLPKRPRKLSYQSEKVQAQHWRESIHFFPQLDQRHTESYRMECHLEIYSDNSCASIQKPLWRVKIFLQRIIPQDPDVF